MCAQLLGCVRLFATPGVVGVSSVHGDSPGQNTGVGCHALLQGTFPTQGLNPALLHCRWILYHLSHQGSPKRLVWVTYPFSRGSSRSSNRTRVSCIAGGFFTSWATQEAHSFCMCDAIFSPTGLYSFSNTVMLSYLFICLFMYQYWARNR